MKIIEKALSDGFVAGRSKQTFESFKKEWLKINNLTPYHSIEKLLSELSEYFDNKADILDAEYSENRPNKEMAFLIQIDEITKRLL